MPTLTRYRQFDGRHWETGSVHNVLAYRGVKAPQYSSMACLATSFPTCVKQRARPQREKTASINLFRPSFPALLGVAARLCHDRDSTDEHKGDAQVGLIFTPISRSRAKFR